MYYSLAEARYTEPEPSQLKTKKILGKLQCHTSTGNIWQHTTDEQRASTQHPSWKQLKQKTDICIQTDFAAAQQTKWTKTEYFRITKSKLTFLWHRHFRFHRLGFWKRCSWYKLNYPGNKIHKSIKKKRGRGRWKEAISLHFCSFSIKNRMDSWPAS